MTATSYLRGHEIEFLNGEWVYSDTKEPTVQTWQERPCGHCGRSATKEGHDACISNLPGVMNACCGHGMTEEAYVQFWNRDWIGREDAVRVQDVLKNVKEWKRGEI